MPYARIDTTAIRHKKLRQISAEARWLWIAGLAYAQDGLTDGVLDDLTPEALGCKVTKALIAELVRARLWEGKGSAYRIHDYGEWNDLKAAVEQKRQRAKTRYQRWRDHAQDNAPPNALANAFENASTNASENASANASVNAFVNAPRAFVPVSGSGSGSSGEGGPGGEPSAQLALWDDFVAIGRVHGFDYRLQPTPKEYGHLVQLIGAYSPDELHAMAVVFWASAYLPADRNLGLFTSKSGALFKHVQDRNTGPFGAPVDAKAVAAEAQQAAIRKWASS